MAGAITSQSHHRLKGRFVAPEVRRVFGELHGRVDGEIQAITFTTDQRCLTLEEGGLLRQWNPANGNLIESVTLSAVETCWAFSSDGRFLASGSSGIAIWDSQTGEMLGRHEDPSWMTTLLFSPDSRRIASGHDDHKVRLWDSQTGKLVRIFNGHHDEISALAFSADGRFLATAAEDRLVLIWDTKTGDLAGKLEGHTDRVDDLAWSPTGHRIASAGWDTSVRVWDPKSGELLALLNGQGECVHAVSFTPDNRSIVCGDSNGFFRVWDYARLKIKGEFQAHPAALRVLALSKDGKIAATAGLDRVLRFIDVSSAQPLVEDDGPRTAVASLATGPGQQMAVVHAEGSLSFFDAGSGKTKAGSIDEETATCASSSAAGEVVVGTASGKFALFPKGSGPHRWVGEGQIHSPVRLIAVRPDGKQLASSAALDGTVRIYDIESGEPVLIIPEATHCGTVEAIAYHPSLPIVAASGILWNEGGEGATVLWDTQAIRMNLSFARGATALTFSPDGRFLAGVCLDESIVVWDLSTARVVKELAGTEGSTNAIAFDPDGQVFVSVSDDGGVRAWDIPSWRMTANLEIDTRIRTIRFTQDGEQVVLGNANGACYVLDIASLL